MAVLRRQVIKCNFLHRLFLLKAVWALMVFFSAFGAYQKIVQRRSALTNPAMLPRRVPHHHRMVRHIFGYNAASRNKSIFPNPMPADNGRIRPNARSFPYRGVGIVLRATLRIFASWPLDVGKHHGRAAKDIVSQLYALIQRNIILDFAVVTYSDMVLSLIHISRVGPTPNIPITTGYSGREAARDCISCLRAANAEEVVWS